MKWECVTLNSLLAGLGIRQRSDQTRWGLAAMRTGVGAIPVAHSRTGNYRGNGPDGREIHNSVGADSG